MRLGRLSDVTDFALGWHEPEDRSHESRYALAEAMPSVPCPVVIGVNWYTSFDRPTRDAQGIYWIGRTGDWGSVRGGHCVCLRPPTISDVVGAHRHYNQLAEGACVGMGVSRAATLYNRKTYDGFSLYFAARRRDEWEGENYSGTSVNAGLQTLRIEGAWLPTPSGSRAFVAEGCTSFLWARSVTEITSALKTQEPFVRILNSWGTAYPAEVRIGLDALARLIGERAEAGVPIDRPNRKGSRKNGNGND